MLFSADRTPTSSLYTGLTALATIGWLGLHRHTAAEVYHLVEGSGVVVLDGVEHPVAAGSAVFIPGVPSTASAAPAMVPSGSSTRSRPTRSTTWCTGPPTADDR